MTSSCDKFQRALLSCLSRPPDVVMEQKAPRSVSWRFKPKKLAKEIDESASVVVGVAAWSDDVFFRQIAENNALSFLSTSRL